MDVTNTGESCLVFFSDSHVSQLTRSLYDLQKNDIACDIVFTNTKGTNHIAHSVVLCAASKFLQRLIAAARCEAATEVKDKVFVTLDGVHDESIKCILKFIYTGEMRLKDYTIKEVYEKCIEWELGEAVKICRRYLQTLPKDYVIDTLGLGTALNTIETEQDINQKTAQKSSVDELLQKHAKLTYYPKNDDIVIRENVQDLLETVLDTESQDEDPIKGDIHVMLLSDDVQRKLLDCDNELDTPAAGSSNEALKSISKPLKRNDMQTLKKKKLETLSRKWNKRQTKALIPKLEKDTIVVIPSPYPESSAQQKKLKTPINPTEETPSIDINHQMGNLSNSKEDERLQSPMGETEITVPVLTTESCPPTDGLQVNEPIAEDVSEKDKAVTRLRSRSPKVNTLESEPSTGTRRSTRSRGRKTSSQSHSWQSSFESCILPVDAQEANPAETDDIKGNSTMTTVSKLDRKEAEYGDQDYADADISGESEAEEKILPPKKRLKRAQYASKSDSTNNGPYCCSHCMKLFKYRTSYHKHITICEKDKNNDITNVTDEGMPCKQCKEVFPSADSLKAHMVIHDKPFVCDQCSYRTRRQARLAEHKYRKHGFPLENAGLEIYACKEEGCSFKTVHASVMLAHHNTKHTDGRPFMCETCGATMKSLMSLRQHKRIHAAKHDTYKCEECNATYKSKSALELHVKSIHKKVVDFLCTHCPYGTVSKNTLQSHMLSAHGIIPEGKTVYTCEYCGWQTIIRHLMKKHLTRHKGEKSFECEICHHKFVLAGDLKAHMKRHDTETPKKRCPFPDCKYSDYGNHKLQQHIRINHTEKGIKPWECHICDYATAIKGNLTKHLRAVHHLSVVTNQKRLTKISSAPETKTAGTEGEDTQEEGAEEKEAAETKEKPAINVNELRRKNQLTESVCTDGFNMGNTSQDEDTNSGNNIVQQHHPSVVIHHGKNPAESGTPRPPPPLQDIMVPHTINTQVFTQSLPNPPPYQSALYLGNTHGMGKADGGMVTQHLPLSSQAQMSIPGQGTAPGMTGMLPSTVLTQSIPQVSAPSVQHWTGNRAPLTVSYPGTAYPVAQQPAVTQDMHQDIDIDMFVTALSETHAK